MEFKKDYDVAIPSAFYLEYREGKKLMKVEIDFRDELPVLSHRAVRSWEPPHDAEVVLEEKRRQIIENIIIYLNQVRQFKFEVDGGQLVESRVFGQ